MSDSAGEQVVYRIERTNYATGAIQTEAAVKRGGRYFVVDGGDDAGYASLADLFAGCRDVLAGGYSVTVDCTELDDVELSGLINLDDRYERPSEEGDLVLNDVSWVWQNGALLPLYPDCHPLARHVATISWEDPPGSSPMGPSAYEGGTRYSLYRFGRRYVTEDTSAEEGRWFDAGPVGPDDDEAAIAASYISGLVHPWVDEASAPSLSVDELLEIVRETADPSPYTQPISLNGERFVAADGEVRPAQP